RPLPLGLHPVCNPTRALRLLKQYPATVWAPTLCPEQPRRAAAQQPNQSVRSPQRDWALERSVHLRRHGPLPPRELTEGSARTYQPVSERASPQLHDDSDHLSESCGTLAEKFDFRELLFPTRHLAQPMVQRQG